MPVDESRVTQHYGGSGLLHAIEAGLHELGKTRSTATLDDLGPVEEFHIGGRTATKALCQRLGVTSETRILDIGCGIGGAARFIASSFGCHVAGLDLTPDYVEVGRSLTSWTGLEDKVRLEVGSALDMPFPDKVFDAATQLHVGMNIADKDGLFTEAYRVLTPEGRLGVYDIMRTAEGDITFPVPWASDASTSFVESITDYRGALEAAGFEIEQEHDLGSFALDFFATVNRGASRAGGPPPIGLHLIMGRDAPQKIANMVAAVSSGALAPVELICRKR